MSIAIVGVQCGDDLPDDIISETGRSYINQDPEAGWDAAVQGIVDDTEDTGEPVLALLESSAQYGADQVDPTPGYEGTPAYTRDDDSDAEPGSGEGGEGTDNSAGLNKLVGSSGKTSDMAGDKVVSPGYSPEDTTQDPEGHYYLGPSRRRVGAGFGRRRAPAPPAASEADEQASEDAADAIVEAGQSSEEKKEEEEEKAEEQENEKEEEKQIEDMENAGESEDEKEDDKQEEEAKEQVKDEEDSDDDEDEDDREEAVAEDEDDREGDDADESTPEDETGPTKPLTDSPAVPAFWALDGCTTEGNWGTNKDLGEKCFESNKQNKATVRCCSKVSTQCYSKKGACFSKSATYAQANTICANAGYRLCTQQEVESQLCCRTGCMYDHQRVWTSSGCSELLE